MSSSLIDIVIPVYRDVEGTRRCIESVLSSKDPSLGQVIIINDASPEDAMSACLSAFGGNKEIKLVEHATNFGFVASVNEGINYAADRDVVILNSDTEVPSGWLDRLKSAAEANPKAASITPFSNNATICSYPHFCTENPLIEGFDLETLDALVSHSNRGVTVEVPTGVGFCMFMRRAAIDEIGLFDEEAFGRGYGEENDWCLRASAKGWHHLLCADLFVYHAGGASFGEGAKTYQQRALEVISTRYPDYEQTIAQFVEQDPAEPVRHAIDLDRARQGFSDQVLAEYRQRTLEERSNRYALDRARHQQVQTLERLLADAREHVTEEGRRYKAILAEVREEAGQRDQQYAVRIKDMARDYNHLADEYERVNKLWFVRLWRRLTGQRSGR